MTLSGFYLLFAAILVILLGEWMTRVIGPLRRSHIPPPVVSGLLVALLVLGGNEFGWFALSFDAKVGYRWWTWLVLPEVDWWTTPAPKVDVHQPLLIAFFTCIGLNASWNVAKKGSWQLLIYLVIATVFAAAQNGLGVVLAKMLGENPLLGLLCSGVSLMGGFGTAAGFAGEFEKAGLAGAAVIGTAAAAFGVVSGSLIGGPVGRHLVSKHVRRRVGFPVMAAVGSGGAAIVDHSTVAEDACEAEEVAEHDTFFKEIRSLVAMAPKALLHLVILLLCIKAGAWVYYAMKSAGLTFPVYIGAMIVGVVLRNIIDLLPRPFIESDTVDKLASVCLSWMLAVIIMSLKLTELVHSAAPMLIILVVQVIFMVAFAYWIVFRLMGRDYEAATMSVGMIGFGLGATSNAVATMKQMTKAYGPAPRAFLIVTVVGAFLIDFTNSIIITGFMNVLK